MANLAVPKPQIVLGIDPGIGRMGWGVIKAGTPETCLGYGCIETLKTRSESERLVELEKSLEPIITKFKPELVALEQLFFSKNQTTAMSVAHARGVALLVIGRHRMQLVELSPSRIKSVVAGTATAKKPQMQLMIQRQLRLREKPRPDDAADALAIALAGLSQVRWNKMTNATT